MARQDKIYSIAVAKRITSLKRSNETWEELARRIGLSPQAVSNYATNHNPNKKVKAGAGVDAIVKVMRATGFSGTWILTGEGPKMRRRPSEADRALTLREAAAKEAIDLIGAAKEVLESGEPAGRAIGPIGEAASDALEGELSSDEASERQEEDPQKKKRTRGKKGDPK